MIISADDKRFSLYGAQQREQQCVVATPTLCLHEPRVEKEDNCVATPISQVAGSVLCRFAGLPAGLGIRRKRDGRSRSTV